MKAVKGRFGSLPFLNGAAFKSINVKDARVLGLKGGTPWKSTSSRGKSSSAFSAEFKKKLKLVIEELAYLRLEIAKGFEQVDSSLEVLSGSVSDVATIHLPAALLAPLAKAFGDYV